MQYCGEAVETAKQATENTRCPAREVHAADRLRQPLAEAPVRRDRRMRFPRRRGPAGSVVKGQFAIVGPVALFRATTGLAGLVIRSRARPIRSSARSRTDGGRHRQPRGQREGLLPLDPSRGGALKELVQKTNLIHIFEKGGPIMWPLLLCSVLALGTVIERVLFLIGEKRKRDAKAMDASSRGRAGDTESAIRIGKESKFYVVRTLGYALAHKETSLANALLFAQANELKRFRRGIPILDTVITLAPLLGLLGTITGMMNSFSLIGGDLSAPGAITGGIAEALIATAFGLGIAITSLIRSTSSTPGSRGAAGDRFRRDPARVLTHRRRAPWSRSRRPATRPARGKG